MTASAFADLAVAPTPRPPRRVAAEFLRYFACSAVALAADFALFSLGVRLGIGYPLPAAVGFLAGLWLAYTLSVRVVFVERSVADARVEFVLFAAIGLAGLLLTEGMLWLLVQKSGFSPMSAKLGTAGVVFVFNFVARKCILFTRAQEVATA